MTPSLRSVVVSAVTAATLLAACGGDDGGDSSSSVVIYSGRTEDLVGPILAAYEEESGVDVEVRYGQSADLALLIEEEAAAGRAEADVFLSQSPGAVGVLQQDGRLAVLPDRVLDLVDESVRDPGGRWVGFSGRQRVLVYNTELVDESELPASVFELTDPEWSGRIGIAPGNGSFQDFVTAMRVTEGDDVAREWLEGIAANDPVSYPNNSAIVAAAGRGEIDAGLVNHYYNFRALDEDPTQPTANHLFPPDDPGGVLIITGAAVVEGTDDPEGAADLIAFLLGDEGQTYFAEQTFEYPLAIGQEPAGEVPEVDFGDASTIDYETLGGGLASTREMIVDAGLEG